jgi:UDP-N-acetylglucosamine transferase subunit ALG13
MPGTFVTVGNAHQPFARLTSAVIAAKESLPRPAVMQHGHTPCEDHELKLHAFLPPEEYEGRVRGADVVIMHAGAGSILHAIHAGKVPIVMARLRKFGEHVDDHQLEFAEAMAAEGRVVLIDDGNELQRAVKEALRRQRAIPSRASHPQLVDLVGEVLKRYDRDGI